MGKGGGGFDAGPLVEQGNRSLALQREIYNDTVDRSQPFLDAGVNSINRLSDLLGINGGSVQTRDQIRSELAPQYTTTQSNGPANTYVGRDGNIATLRGHVNQVYGGYASGADYDAGAITQNLLNDPDRLSQFVESNGLSQFSQPSSSVDNQGLDAAVDTRFAEQGTPDDFGSLLQGFGQSDFEADPGYQFRLDEANRALERQYAARGQSFTPQALRGIAEVNSGLASQEYQNAYNRFNNDQNNVFNRLAAVSGVGQTTNQQLAATGSNFANASTQINSEIGNAITSAQVANASQPSLFGSIAGTALGAFAGPAGAAIGGRIGGSI